MEASADVEATSIKTLDELKEADERSLVFSPWGLGGRMHPEAAAEFQQRAISAELEQAVPNGTRQSLDRLRTIHAYGVLCYDFFTVADELALLVLERLSASASSPTTRARSRSRTRTATGTRSRSLPSRTYTPR